MRWLSRTEGILPALESAHALAVVPRLLAGVDGAARARRSGAGRAPGWPEETVLLVGLSGRGDKDLASFGRWLDEHGT